VQGRFRRVPYQEAADPPVPPELRHASAHAVHVVTARGEILRAGRASLFVLGQIGWPRTARVLGIPPLCWVVELGYWLVARLRGALSRVLREEPPGNDR
jgi:hypothetical protein